MRQILIFLSILGIACNDNFKLPSNLTTKEYVVIQALLSDSQKRQKILISKTKSPEDGFFIETIDSAIVAVNGINFFPSDKFDEFSDPYNYYSDELVIEQSKNYELIVKVNCDTITANMTVPGDFEIKSQNSVVYWTKSNNAYIYYISGASTDNTDDFILGTVTTDTCYNIFEYEPDFQKGWYDAQVYAFDRNYYEYTKIGHNSVGFNQDNVLGFFGAMIIRKQKIYISSSQL